MNNNNKIHHNKRYDQNTAESILFLFFSYNFLNRYLNSLRLIGSLCYVKSSYPIAPNLTDLLFIFIILYLCFLSFA